MFSVVYVTSVRMLLRGLLECLSAGAFRCSFCNDVEFCVARATVVDGLC